MSKKKSKLESWFDQHEGGGKKSKEKSSPNKKEDSKKRKGKKDDAWAKPKLLRVKSTLSDKEEKRSREIVEQTPKVNKDLLRIRSECNHCQDTMSVAEFRTKPNAYVTPLLDKYVEVFGEDSVALCRGCYEAVVDGKKIEVKETESAFIIALASIDFITANYRLDKKEFNSMKDCRDEILKAMYMIMPVLTNLKNAQAELARTKPATIVPGPSGTPSGHQRGLSSPTATTL